MDSDHYAIAVPHTIHRPNDQHRLPADACGTGHQHLIGVVGKIAIVMLAGDATPHNVPLTAAGEAQRRRRQLPVHRLVERRGGGGDAPRALPLCVHGAKIVRAHLLCQVVDPFSTALCRIPGKARYGPDVGGHGASRVDTFRLGGVPTPEVSVRGEPRLPRGLLGRVLGLAHSRLGQPGCESELFQSFSERHFCLVWT